MAFLTPPPPSPPCWHPPGGSPPTPDPHTLSAVLPNRRRRPTPAFTFPNPFANVRTFYFKSYHVFRRKKLPEDVVHQHLRPLLNRPVKRDEIMDALVNINAWFKENHYILSRLEVRRLPTRSDPRLELVSREPIVFVISTVGLNDENKPDPSVPLITRPRVITNALGLQEGDVFAWTPTGFARIFALGVFETARAEVKLHAAEDAELILYLRERKPGRIEPGAGLSSDGRVYGDISIVDSNFMGRAQRLRVEWQKRLDVPRSSGGIAFEDMRVGASVPFSFRMRAYRDANADRALPTTPQQAQPAVPVALQPDTPLRYEADRDGMLLDFGYRPHGGSILLNLMPMLERVHRTGMDASAAGCVQGVLQTSVTHATRLPVDLPRSGHILRVEQCVGTNLFEAPSAFYRTVVKAAKYFAIGSKGSIATGLTFGIGSDNLPFHEQKSIGGHGTVRGYDYGELGRYRSYGTGRMELRVPLAFGAGEEEMSAQLEEVPTGKTKGKIIDKSDDVKINNKPVDSKEKDSKSKGEGEDEGRGGLLEKLPPLVGVLFGDMGIADNREVDVVGASYGLGVRVGGVVAVEWTTTLDGRKSRVHIGLVDRSL